MFQGTSVKSQRIIYTPSSFARDNLLYLQETGSLRSLKPHTSKRDGLLSYLFLTVSDGEGIIRYEGHDHRLSAGDCAFIDCRSAYSHTSSEDHPWELSWVHFSGNSMNGIYEKYRQRGGLAVFHPSDSSEIKKILQSLFEIAGSENYMRDMLINEKLSCLLTLVMAESWHPENRRESGEKLRHLDTVADYLEEHYTEKITLDMLSEKFYINKYYLTRIFREQYGMTIGNYLDHIRITQAKELLRFTQLSAEEIGAKVGIDEPGYFNRVFKKIEKVTPGEYRKKW